MTTTTETQRETRSSHTGHVSYRYDDETGSGTWMDVSRVGAQVLLGRYLRPGRTLTLRFASPLVSNRELEVTAQVVWCRPEKYSQDFTVGLLIQRDTPEMALDFATLGHAAREEKAPKSNKVERPKVPVTVWSGFEDKARTQTNPTRLATVAQAV